MTSSVYCVLVRFLTIAAFKTATSLPKNIDSDRWRLRTEMVFHQSTTVYTSRSLTLEIARVKLRRSRRSMILPTPDHMGDTGLPVRDIARAYDVTYATGCRGRVTRPARPHGIIKKARSAAEGDRERKGWHEGRRTTSIPRFSMAGLNRRTDRSIVRGTYAYTCPRRSTMGLSRDGCPMLEWCPCAGGIYHRSR